MESQKHLTDMHSAHQVWMNQISLLSDELLSFNKRLEEVAVSNSQHDVTAKVEHFQNQFILQKEVIDFLKHDISLAEQSLVDVVSNNPVATDRKRVADEPDLRDRVETFVKLFNELKLEYHNFLGKSL